MSSATSDAPWLIYGANGYTGRLIANAARAAGMRPILAGRNRQKIERLAAEVQLESRIFELSPAERRRGLDRVRLVLNCAGPFALTAPQMIAACIEAGAHYLDITGEIEVIELAAAHMREALTAEVTLMPAVGFDVVPSDCLAKALSEQLPSATRLTLAFSDTGGISPGTAKTVLRGMPNGSCARIDGRLVPVPAAWKAREIPFADHPRWAMTIPWGDLASAYYSTGIKNIETYAAVPRAAVGAIRRMRWALPLLSATPVAWTLNKLVPFSVRGPNEEQRTTRRAQFWGEVSDGAGRAVRGTLETASGYHLTVLTALECTRRVLARECGPGFYTPAKAFGHTLIESIPGSVLRVPADAIA